MFNPQLEMKLKEMFTSTNQERFGRADNLKFKVFKDSCKRCFGIVQNENGKKHRHYVDIFIPSQKRCIEVKSTLTAKKNEHNIFLKQNAAKELGYKYEIWVYDKNGNKVETYL